MVGGAHGGIPLEVVGTVIEMADVAWYALEHRPHRKATAAEPPPEESPPSTAEAEEEEVEMEQIRLENLRLRTQLADNLNTLQSLYKAPSFSKDCPPDLYERLTAVIDSSSFLSNLDSLHQESKLPPNKTGIEDNDLDVPISIDGELSWWVWVTDKISIDNLEEISGIDNENYVIISEDSVIDGIASFIARCIIENPKSKMMSPEELHRAVTKALSAMRERIKWKSIWEAGKVIYTLSTWGIFLAGLYRNRAIVKAAAKGVGATSKFVMKML